MTIKWRILAVTYLMMASLTVYIGDAGGTNAERHTRVRRFLTFPNNSQFFVRLNFKANMVPWNQIFAQALGFRLNFDEPPDTFHPWHRLYRRDLYTKLEVLFDRNGLEGFHCIRRAICEVNSLPTHSGIYHKLLKIIFRRQSSSTDRWHEATRKECDMSLASCPFSLLHILLYTDL